MPRAAGFTAAGGMGPGASWAPAGNATAAMSTALTMRFMSILLLRRPPLAGHGRGVERLGDLLLAEDLLLPQEIQDPAPRLHRLRGQRGGLVVADHRIEGGDGADAV